MTDHLKNYSGPHPMYRVSYPFVQIVVLGFMLVATPSCTNRESEEEVAGGKITLVEQQGAPETQRDHTEIVDDTSRGGSDFPDTPPNPDMTNEELYAHLQSTNPFSREIALHLLNERKAISEAQLRELLEDPYPQIRVTAAGMLLELGVEDAAQILRDMLSDSDISVRQYAIKILYSMNDRASLPAFKKMWETRDDEVRIELMQPLLEWDLEFGKAALLALFSDGVIPDLLHLEAARKLVHVKVKEVNLYLPELLKSSDPEYVQQVILVMVKSGDAAFLPTIEEYINQEKLLLPLVMEILENLHEIDDPRTRELLKDKLNHPVANVRLVAAHSLAKMGDSSGVKVLESALMEAGDLDIRPGDDLPEMDPFFAAEGLVYLGDERGEQWLVKTLDHHDPFFVLYAARTLCELNHEAGIAKLEQLSKSAEDPRLKDEASSILVECQGDDRENSSHSSQ